MGGEYMLEPPTIWPRKEGAACEPPRECLRSSPFSFSSPRPSGTPICSGSSRGSPLLDRYDHPLGDRISSARSLAELVRLYDPVKREADRIQAAAAKDHQGPSAYDENLEPFRSERDLRQAIQGWEGKNKEIRSLRFYWTAGFLVLCLGFVLHRWGNRWAGLTLEIAAFAEFIYWTSPSFFRENVREFDRLLTQKLLLSVVSVVLLAGVIKMQGIFADPPGRATERAR